MNEVELKAAMQNCPKSIGATSGALLLMAVLFVVHRGYSAHTMGIVLWKGIMAGSFPALLSTVAAFRIHRREKWFYWLLLVVAVAIFGATALHGLAEVIRAVGGEKIDLMAWAMTAAFALLSGVVAFNLLRREARDFFGRKQTGTSTAPETP